MAGKRPAYDYGLCMACGICVQACPVSCLELRRTGLDAYRKAYPELARPDTCTSCGICADSCPVEAVRMTGG
ncbi:MAG TPA: 4Fe-4S binding protein [Magnetospirillaceae bacterium]|nr:4Fe-4S binding protein [Magnetospirillaceae bacterium]